MPDAQRASWCWLEPSGGSLVGRHPRAYHGLWGPLTDRAHGQPTWEQGRGPRRPWFGEAAAQRGNPPPARPMGRRSASRVPKAGVSVTRVPTAAAPQRRRARRPGAAPRFDVEPGPFRQLTKLEAPGPPRRLRPPGARPAVPGTPSLGTTARSTPAADRPQAARSARHIAGTAGGPARPSGTRHSCPRPYPGVHDSGRGCLGCHHGHEGGVGCRPKSPRFSPAWLADDTSMTYGTSPTSRTDRRRAPGRRAPPGARRAPPDPRGTPLHHDPTDPAPKMQEVSRSRPGFPRSSSVTPQTHE